MLSLEWEENWRSLLVTKEDQPSFFCCYEHVYEHSTTPNEIPHLYDVCDGDVVLRDYPGPRSLKLGWCTGCKRGWGELPEHAGLRGKKAGRDFWLCTCSTYSVVLVRRKPRALWCAEAGLFRSHEVTCTEHHFWTPIRKRLTSLQLNCSSHRSCIIGCCILSQGLSIKGNQLPRIRDAQDHKRPYLTLFADRKQQKVASWK